MQLSFPLVKKILIPFLLVMILVMSTANGAPASVQAHPAFGMPTLKWQLGGCYDSWCETGWYSSPAAVDLDNDGQVEVVASDYSIFALDGSTGTLEWRIASGHDRSEPGAGSVGRTWPGIVLADVNNDGLVEIATAHGGGWVSVYNSQGYFEPGWPQQPTTSELRGLSVSDLNGDGEMEVIVTGAVASAVNTWVYSADGILLPGWPQLSNDSGYAFGVYNANASAGDLNHDGMNELLVPSDVTTICAYHPDGTQLPANPIYGEVAWGAVGVWESLATELRGWGYCDGNRTESYRPNFAASPSVIADVNGDDSDEVVVTGNVYDCSNVPYTSKYDGVYIFNSDRSRFNAGGYDWQSTPVDTGAPISEDYSVIESNQPNPAVADLDSDGLMEILYPAYDGRVHAFWLDKTEHGNWPYSVYNPAQGIYRFASEPVIADLDGNGYAEVIFTSWTQKGSNQTGKLHILDYLGNPVYEVALPDAFGGADWNGALPAPTLENLDSDPDLEVVVLTAHSGVVAYDLPGTANATILWGTGRGNYQRDGNQANSIQSTLAGSAKTSSSTNPFPGNQVTFTITLRNTGRSLNTVSLADPIPAHLSYIGNLWASSGIADYSAGVVHWNGAVNTSKDVVIHFDVIVDPGLALPTQIVNAATIADGYGHVVIKQAYLFVFYNPFFLSLVAR